MATTNEEVKNAEISITKKEVIDMLKAIDGVKKKLQKLLK